MYCTAFVLQELVGTAYRNRTHIRRVEACRIIHYTKAVYLVDCSRVELLSCLSYKHLLAIYTVTAHIETHY